MSVSGSVFVSFSLSLSLSLSLSFPSLLTCLSLSSALLLSPAQPVRRLVPRPRDARGVAISVHRVMLPCQHSVHALFLGAFHFLCGLVEVGLTEEATVGSFRGGAGTCQNKTNQPGGKE